MGKSVSNAGAVGIFIVAVGVIAIVLLCVDVWAGMGRWVSSRGGMVEEGGMEERGEDVRLWIMGLYITA